MLRNNTATNQYAGGKLYFIEGCDDTLFIGIRYPLAIEQHKQVYIAIRSRITTSLTAVKYHLGIWRSRGESLPYPVYYMLPSHGLV